MTKPNSCNFNSIFLFLSTNAEVCSMIDRLKTKKAQRYTDIETKFIKYGKLIISPIISNLSNLIIETGVFSNCLKIAKVTSFIKKGIKICLLIIDPFRYYLNSTKVLKKRYFPDCFRILIQVNFSAKINLPFDLTPQHNLLLAQYMIN